MRWKDRMLGTAHWCGTYNTLPAVQLSYHGGADLWVFDGARGWRRELRAETLRGLCEKMNMPFRVKDQHSNVMNQPENTDAK